MLNMLMDITPMSHEIKTNDKPDRPWSFIALKASAERACNEMQMSYCYGVQWVTVIVVRVVTVTLLIWSAGKWFIHKGAKSGCEVVKLFGSDCDDGVSAGIWVILTGLKSGGHAFWRLL